METGDRNFSLGDVFSRTFGVIGGAAPAILGVSFLLGALPQAIWGYIAPNLLIGTSAPASGPAIVVSIVGGLVIAVLSTIVQGAVVQVTVAHGEGRTVSISQALGVGVAMVLPLIGLGFLSWLGIMLGLVLLVVPGIILALMWCVAAPALVAERQGIVASLGRSRYLTKGARWKVFGLLLVILAVIFVLSMILGIILIASGGSQIGQAPGIIATVLGMVINTLFMAFWSAIIASLFVELRNWKDGLTSENLADVFA